MSDVSINGFRATLVSHACVRSVKAHIGIDQENVRLKIHDANDATPFSSLVAANLIRMVIGEFQKK